MWVSCGLSGSAHIFEFNRSAFYILLFLLQIFFIKHQKCPIIEFNSRSLPDGFSTFEFSRCKNQLLFNEIKSDILSYFWLERLPSCVTLFPEQTDTSGQVKLSILHLSSALVFLTIWPDQLCQFVPLCLPPQKDCYKVSPSYFATIQTF